MSAEAHRGADLAARVHALGLARDLSLELGLEVSVAADLAPADAYVVVVGPRNAPLDPRELRISPRTQDSDLPLLRKTRRLCTDYNDSTARLRHLAGRAKSLVQRGVVALVPGSAFSAIYFKLAAIDTEITARALATSAGGRLSLRVLQEEIAGWKIVDAQIAPVVMAAGQLDERRRD